MGGGYASRETHNTAVGCKREYCNSGSHDRTSCATYVCGDEDYLPLLRDNPGPGMVYC